MLSTLPRKIRRALSMPPSVVAHKLWWRSVLKTRNWRTRHKDAGRSTYGSYLALSGEPRLASFFKAPGRETLEPFREALGGVCANYLEHRFDLLGSGWVQVRHGMECAGLEGHRHESGPAVRADRKGDWLAGLVPAASLPRSREIWGLVGEGYVPLDWQLDFKSGFRWSERTWYGDIEFGGLPGVDVKVPWELARLQHLPQLALAYILAHHDPAGLPGREALLSEFRNETLDFLAANPPRFGVNWACPMDVAIRAVNLLVAFDLFRAGGAWFDHGFEESLLRGIMDHGRHIAANLEWSPDLRGNHYLSDITGLLFAAAYLPRTAATDTWLAFALQELPAEVQSQFWPDGSNFEASTSYHRLSAELAAWATALTLALPPEKLQALDDYDHERWNVRPALRPPPRPLQEASPGAVLSPFSPWYLDRLRRMGEFTMLITRPDGLVSQFGDNDSGRLLKLTLSCDRLERPAALKSFGNLTEQSQAGGGDIFWAERHLDHRHLLAVLDGLFDRPDFAAYTAIGGGSSAAGGSQPPALETALVRGLFDNRAPLAGAAPGGPGLKGTGLKSRGEKGGEKELERLGVEFRAAGDGERWEMEFAAPGADLRTNLEWRAFPDFGMYVFRSERIYLAVRCGPVGQNGNGGHAHNDQLSLEFFLDGKPVVEDPGTYVYTPLPEGRNRYRSVRAHFAPLVNGREPESLDEGLFRLSNRAQADCLYFGPLGFAGAHSGYGSPVKRMVLIQEQAIRVADWGRGLRLSPSQPDKPLHSPGYGILNK
ncbi:MAG: heparinase II/III family protein [Deltaproteobacteria bacterium]|nr:heparinase II/III family protein [Deltaproteobacteria bacterium]